MGRRFFNPESLVWRIFGFIGDLVTFSLLWALCSIPLVTLGPATAALYDTMVHTLRRKESAPLSRFFSTFRRELREGLVLTLLCAAAALALGLVLYASLRLFPAFAERGALVSLAELLLAFFFLAAASWVFPTLSRFSMSAASLGRNCLRLAAGHAPRSAALALLNAAVIAAVARFVFPVMFAPALAAYLSSFLLEPVFEQYEKTDG